MTRLQSAAAAGVKFADSISTQIGHSRDKICKRGFRDKIHKRGFKEKICKAGFRDIQLNQT